MNTPRTIWRLQIKHEYFRDGFCRGISVVPAKETLKLMNRRSLVFRYAHKSTWILMSLAGQECHSDDMYEFHVQLTDSLLSYITASPAIIPEKAVKLEITGYDTVIEQFNNENLVYERSYPGTFMHMQLQFITETNEASPVSQTEICFRASAYYWEYILLFRKEEDPARTIILNDANGKLVFSEPQKTEYMGQKAVKFRSLQKVPSREVYTYKLQLTEVTGQRQKEVMKKVPYPEPGIFLDVSRDTMQQIVYL